MEYGVVSIIIPLFTIAAAIITKDVVISLLGGAFFGLLVLNGYSATDAFVALFDGIVALFAEGWIVKTILFVVLVGSIMEMLNRSGAVDEFVEFLSQKAQKIDSPIGAMLLAYTIGLIIFIESSITVMVASIVAKPLCDKNGVSREKLAYICDSTSAPVCTMIPLNGWGALLLGLITSSIASGVIQGDAINILIQAILLNFYAIFAIVVVLFVIVKDINIGPMRKAKPRAYIPISSDVKSRPKPWGMIFPLIILVGAVFTGLYLTGNGDILKGSGSTSVYYAVISTLIFLYIYFVPVKRLTHKGYFDALYKGLSDMIPIAIVVILAFLIGKVIGELGTAAYMASMLDGAISPIFIPLLVFLLSSIMAFATGTSWGTFSVMMPIALALGGAMDISSALMAATVISGGVFGDHASPISDTTIISSMAAGCDNMDHVRTQLPYALVSAFLASIAFLVAGFVQLN
ncbi:MAG: sodium:proton antiporter [Campylobacterales bacterium]|nr:sodium:proton antiporter [Campylobacterales bacterium]